MDAVIFEISSRVAALEISVQSALPPGKVSLDLAQRVETLRQEITKRHQFAQSISAMGYNLARMRSRLLSFSPTHRDISLVDGSDVGDVDDERQAQLHELHEFYRLADAHYQNSLSFLVNSGCKKLRDIQRWKDSYERIERSLDVLSDPVIAEILSYDRILEINREIKSIDDLHSIVESNTVRSKRLSQRLWRLKQLSTSFSIDINQRLCEMDLMISAKEEEMQNFPL